MDISTYHAALEPADIQICEQLANAIRTELHEAEEKIWHAHPVWMLNGNPIVGYSKQKAGIRLMFWSGADFNEPALKPGSGKFKDASIFYTHPSEVDLEVLKRCLSKSRSIQWDYKNIRQRKGQLVRIETHEGNT